MGASLSINLCTKKNAGNIEHLVYPYHESCLPVMHWSIVQFLWAVLNTVPYPLQLPFRNTMTPTAFQTNLCFPALSGVTIKPLRRALKLNLVHTKDTPLRLVLRLITKACKMLFQQAWIASDSNAIALCFGTTNIKQDFLHSWSVLKFLHETNRTVFTSPESFFRGL